MVDLDTGIWDLEGPFWGPKNYVLTCGDGPAEPAAERDHGVGPLGVR